MKTIKYVGMLVAALLLGVQVMNAQNADKRGKAPKGKRMSIEQMMEMKCNRIIKELGLDDNKAARFTEVYQQYMKELHEAGQLDACRKPNMEKPKDKDGKPEMTPPTDAEVDKMLRNRFVIGRKMLDIHEKYYDELREFLSPKQVAKVYDMDWQDRGKFHEEMNRREGMKRPNAPGRPQRTPEINFD